MTPPYTVRCPRCGADPHIYCRDEVAPGEWESVRVPHPERGR